MCLKCGISGDGGGAARKGAPIDVEPKQGGDKNWQAWTHDPDGNKIELMKISWNPPGEGIRGKARQKTNKEKKGVSQCINPSISASLEFRDRPEKKMQLAKRHGFTHMEAGRTRGRPAAWRKVKALLQQYSMEITCFNVPFHPVQVSEEEFASRMEAFPRRPRP